LWNNYLLFVSLGSVKPLFDLEGNMSNITLMFAKNVDNLKFLIGYGLTYAAAKAWLEQEPNYVPI